MLKKIVGGLLAFAILGCVTGVLVRSAFIYILCFMILVATILFGLLVLVVNFIWKMFPKNLKKTHEVEKGRFNTIIFSVIFFFYITLGLIDEIFLRKGYGFVRLLVITTIILFAAFCGWNLIRRSKAITITVSSVVLILLIVSLLSLNTITLKSGETATNDNIKELRSLPYLDWVPAEEHIEKKGVIYYDPNSALEGLNLYCSWTAPEAYLVDMYGNVVHKWAKEVNGCKRWADHVELCKNGDLIVAAADKMLIRLDWDSNIKWKKKIRAHHDVFIDEDKEVLYVLGREDIIVYWHGIPIPIVGDYIAILSPDRTIMKKICLYKLVKERVKLPIIVKLYTGMFRFKEIAKFFVHKVQENWVCQHSRHLDIIHTNSIEVLNRDIEGFCKTGNLLISIRNLDLVVVLDVDKENFVWTWGPDELSMQHDATPLKNGNVLIFDNGCAKGFSRIVEVNPLTKTIVWEYKSNPPEEFYTYVRGGSQRLSNGNTLIAVSMNGQAFEITKNGRIVWDYYNPKVNEKRKTRETMYRVTRITDPEIKKLIKKRI